MKKFFLILLFLASFKTQAQIKCDNWLSTPARYSYVDIGNLNVSGHTITVEAVINRTQPYVSGTGNNIEGDVVSKHDNPNDINYLLRPNHAAITTSNGYFVTPDIEDIQLNKTYHVAMVYDGATLKFYRNGCLMSEVAATGDLFQNSWDTRIGYYQNQTWNTNFIGYINEVRIWNVVRTRGEIQAYMNTSLPNPTSQVGLLAYYTFDNLINKQGNPSWNGTLGGSATINNSNPSCNSINNLCNSSCSNWLQTPSVPSSVRIGQLNVTGDQLTVEAEINRTAPYSGGQVWAGDIVSKHRDPTDANYILRPNSGEITTTNGYYKTPDIADIQLNRTYQIAMVYDGDSLKFYRDGCLMSEIKANGNLVQNSWEAAIGYYSPQLFPNENFIGYINEVRIWNVARTQAQIQTYMNSSLPNPTTQAGLLAYYTFDNLINKQGNASWNGTINGSASINQTNPSCNPIVNSCKVTSCNMSVTKNSDTTVCKGSSVDMFATGGNTYTWTPQTGLDNPGSPNPIATPSVSTKYYVKVDDAAGCSETDSVQITVNNPPVISKSNDTSICMNSAAQLFATGGTSYNWSPASGLDNSSISNPNATPSSTTKYYISVKNSAGCSKTDSVKITVNNLPVISISNDTSICTNSTIQIFATGGSSYNWSPATGLDNTTISNPKATPLSSTNYLVTVTNAAGCSRKDSVNIEVNDMPVISKSNDTTICINSSAKLFASGGSSYAWTPAGSLINPVIANPVASPASSTTYFITVSNGGCSAIDSVHVDVNPVASISTSNDTTLCNNSSTKIFASGGSSYLWSPASFLDNPSSQTPVATPSSTTIFHVRITDSYSCVYNDSVEISVRPPSVFTVSPDNSVCSNTSHQLNASGGDSYEWSPSTSLNDPQISDPVATPDSTITYSVVIKDSTCKQVDTLFTKVTVLPSPNIRGMHSNDIDCSSSSSQLNATGAESYTWSPVTGLDNFGIASPVASPESTTVYTVTGKDQNGCSNSDTVTVKVNFSGNTVYGLPNSFTPNGDGLNDCFGIKYWGQVNELDFSIYNRWGQRVFHTNDPDNCWDGTFKGEPQQADIFVYTIKAKTACGNIDKKGTVTLLR